MRASLLALLLILNLSYRSLKKFRGPIQHSLNPQEILTCTPPAGKTIAPFVASNAKVGQSNRRKSIYKKFRLEGCGFSRRSRLLID